MLRDGLVLDLPLREKDGDAFMSNDVYGHRCINHGSNWNMEGHTFDGIDDYVDCGNDVSLNTDHLTLSAWFNPTTGGFQSSKPIMQKALPSHSNPYYQYSFNYIDKVAHIDELNLHITVGGSWYEIAKQNAGVIYDTWNQTAVTYDGTTVIMYLNGQPIHSETPCSGNISQYNGYLNIGAFPNLAKTSNYVFAGSINEACIYGRALTATEILTYFNITKVRYGL